MTGTMPMIGQQQRQDHAAQRQHPRHGQVEGAVDDDDGHARRTDADERCLEQDRQHVVDLPRVLVGQEDDDDRDEQ